MRVIAYDPDQVVALAGHLGYQMMIEFDAGRAYRERLHRRQRIMADHAQPRRQSSLYQAGGAPRRDQHDGGDQSSPLRV
ncbi:MAG: hypothetical protein WDM79_02515 [Terricaulis sp.]